MLKYSANPKYTSSDEIHPSHKNRHPTNKIYHIFSLVSQQGTPPNLTLIITAII